MRIRSISRPRSGFTLIELLVVIAIIAILISLLVPAVQKVRDAAARTQCLNNLKQIALALHGYHDVNRRFPTGGIDANAATTPAWGWAAFVLPYVEQTPLHNQLGVTKQTLQSVGGNAALAPLTQTPLVIFRCPADENAQPLLSERQFDGGNSLFPAKFTVAKSNYIAVCGGGNTQRLNNNGVLFLGSFTSIASIIDGTSNTFLIGERNSGCKAGAWVGNRNTNGNGVEGTAYTFGRVSIQLNSPDTSANGCHEGFASRHSGGANFAMADGTVRFISDSINFNNGTCFGGSNQFANPGVACTNLSGLGTYQRLGLREDGQPVGDF